jgi:hypothetical protein
MAHVCVLTLAHNAHMHRDAVIWFGPVLPRIFQIMNWTDVLNHGPDQV